MVVAIDFGAIVILIRLNASCCLRGRRECNRRSITMNNDPEGEDVSDERLKNVSHHGRQKGLSYRRLPA